MPCSFIIFTTSTTRSDIRVATLAGGRQHLDSHAARVPVLGDLPSCAPLRGLVLQAARLFDDMLQMMSNLQRFRRKKSKKKCFAVKQGWS